MIGSVRVACCNAASAMLLLARITSGASTAERKRGTHFSLAADPSSLSKGVQGRWSQNFRWPVLVPLLARTYPMRRGRACPLCPGTSDINLFRYRKGVIDLNAEVSDGAFNLGVAEQELHGSQIPRAPIDQGRLGSSE